VKTKPNKANRRPVAGNLKFEKQPESLNIQDRIGNVLRIKLTGVVEQHNTGYLRLERRL